MTKEEILNDLNKIIGIDFNGYSVTEVNGDESEIIEIIFKDRDGGENKTYPDYEFFRNHNIPPVEFVKSVFSSCEL
jgi:hypothetical protein